MFKVTFKSETKCIKGIFNETGGDLTGEQVRMLWGDYPGRPHGLSKMRDLQQKPRPSTDGLFHNQNKKG